MDQKKSPVDELKKSLLLMDEKSIKKFINQKNFTHLEIFFSVKKELHYCHHKNSSCLNYLEK